MLPPRETAQEQRTPSRCRRRWSSLRGAPGSWSSS